VVLMINVVEAKASSVGVGGLCWWRIRRSMRALVAGAIRSVADLPVPSHHRRFPVFQPDNLEQAPAQAKGCMMPWLANCWILACRRLC
jgi:hypothetical protein